MNQNTDNPFPQDIAIKVDGVSKIYPLYKSHRARLKEALHPYRKKYHHDFYALHDVSFEVKKGETVGIIGRNGSGKSTLLSIIAGVLQPSLGAVTVNGNISSLLELGAGFNPELTGLENINFNLSVQGHSQEFIKSKIDDIIAFADIGEFIEQPIKLYSSGMYVRLAFAVYAQIEPDVMIVDEALAVGDAKFQAKCFERLRQLKNNGTSILLVSHSTEQIVTHCSKAILLDGGKIIVNGEPRHVVNRFMDLLFGKEKRNIEIKTPESLSTSGNFKITKDNIVLSTIEDVFHTRPGYNPHEYRWGDGAASILDFCFSSDEEDYPNNISTGAKALLRVSVKFHHTIVRPIFGVTLKTKEGVTVYGVNSETLELIEFYDKGRQSSIVNLDVEFFCKLAPGDYFISLGIASRENENIIPHDRRYDSIHIQVRPDKRFFGLANLDMKISVEKNDV